MNNNKINIFANYLTITFKVLVEYSIVPFITTENVVEIYWCSLLPYFGLL